MAAIDSNLIFYRSLSRKESLLRLCQKKIKNLITKVYLLFYQLVPPIFTTVDEFSQNEEPRIRLPHDSLLSFLRKLLSKFVKIKKIMKDFFLIDVNNRSIQLLKKNVSIGLTTRQFFQMLVEYGEIDSVECDIF